MLLGKWLILLCLYMYGDKYSILWCSKAMIRRGGVETDIVTLVLYIHTLSEQGIDIMYSSTLYYMVSSEYNLPQWGHTLQIIIPVIKGYPYPRNQTSLTMREKKTFHRDQGRLFSAV